jgi:queuine/archaeosine tRNA-ribosyltransferase
MKGVMRSEILDNMAKDKVHEILRFPMHLSDEQCMNQLRTNTNPNIILYIAMMKGVTPIITVGQFKSFVATFDKKKEDKKNTRRIPDSYKRSK